MSKHKIVAILMAPFLAIGGYIAAGYFTSPKPMMRTLISEQGCNLVENSCNLQTKGLTLSVMTDSSVQAGDSISVTVKSTTPVNDVLFSLADKNFEDTPVRLKQKNENIWHGEVILHKKAAVDKLHLRMVVDWDSQLYFADEKIIK